KCRSEKQKDQRPKNQHEHCFAPRVLLPDDSTRCSQGQRSCLQTFFVGKLFHQAICHQPLADYMSMLQLKSPRKNMARKTRRKKRVTPERLMELSFAYGPPLIITAAVNNGVFDSLEKGARTADEVAKQTGALSRSLRILMNALVGVDLLKKDRQGKY